MQAEKGYFAAKLETLSNRGRPSLTRGESPSVLTIGNPGPLKNITLLLNNRSCWAAITTIGLLANENSVTFIQLGVKNFQATQQYFWSSFCATLKICNMCNLHLAKNMQTHLS